MSGRSVNLTTLFLGRLRPPRRFVHILLPVTDNCPSWKSGRRNESMLPDLVSNPGPLTYESGALPITKTGKLSKNQEKIKKNVDDICWRCWKRFYHMSSSRWHKVYYVSYFEENSESSNTPQASGIIKGDAMNAAWQRHAIKSCCSKCRIRGVPLRSSKTPTHRRRKV